MRIRQPRSLSRGQIVLGTILGVFGGVYIWKPLLLRDRFDNVNLQETSNKSIDNKQNGLIFEKYRGHPILLFVGMGLLTGSIIIGYKSFLGPYFDEKRRINAQMMADYLYEKETRKK